MVIKKILVFISLLLLTTEIFAQDWTDLKQIKSVQVISNGGFVINLEEQKSTLCTHDNSSKILFYPNQNGITFEGAKALLSTALIAFTTGTKVNVMYSYSIESDYCWGSALLLTK